MLAARLPGPIAALCYLAVAVQVGVHLRRLGSFGPVVAVLYPAALALFLMVLARSFVLTYGRGRVSWKGRSVETR